MNRIQIVHSALKESGYESDSTLVFRRKEDIGPLSELEQKLAYKTVQSGGDVPLHGLRKPAPERPKGEWDLNCTKIILTSLWTLFLFFFLILIFSIVRCLNFDFWTGMRAQDRSIAPKFCFFFTYHIDNINLLITNIVCVFFFYTLNICMFLWIFVFYFKAWRHEIFNFYEPSATFVF